MRQLQTTHHKADGSANSQLDTSTPIHTGLCSSCGSVAVAAYGKSRLDGDLFIEYQCSDCGQSVDAETVRSGTPRHEQTVRAYAGGD